MNIYEFREFHIRPDMMEAIEAYIKKRRPPGGFLSAVIQNDLSAAMGRADSENLANLQAFVAYFYNEAPADCWGSPAKMKAWLEDEEDEIDPDEIERIAKAVGVSDEDARKVKEMAKETKER